MTPSRWIALLLSCCPTLLHAQVCAPGTPVAFTGVDVLTMLDATLLRNRIVVVDGGRIASIDATSPPAGACVVDARGQVLMPGLADMHAHFTSRDLPLFLANGVTLVRKMNGTPEMVALRERVARREVVGPRLLVASPLLVGEPLRFRHKLILSAEEAYAFAHEAKDIGYDYLKVYDGLSRASYDALVEAGKTLDIPLDGHVPRDVGLTRVLESGQSIQHMDKISMSLGGGHSDTSGTLAEARRQFAGKATWVTPTIASLRALDLAGTPAYVAALRRPEMALVDSSLFGWWRSLARGGQRPERVSPFYQRQIALLSVLREARIPLLLGTDASNPLMVPGYSVHEELEALVRDGGFSRFDALQTATVNPARFIADTTSGVVRVGARADLVLLAGNPLEDLAHLREPVGVMVQGRWLDRQALRDLVARR